MFTLVLRLVFSLGVVITLMYVAARVMRRRGMGISRSSRTEIAVLARKGLSKHASVALIEAEGRQLLIGVTDQRVTLLSELDRTAIESDDELDIDLESEHHGTVFFTKSAPSALPSDSARKGLLDTLRDMTVRRV